MADFEFIPASEVRSFRQLLTWQSAMHLAVEVYQTASELPGNERFELGKELRRSAISVPSNIAEGFNRHSRAAYRSHVAIALGSAGELETQVELAHRLGFLDIKLVNPLLESCGNVGRLAQGLWRALR